MVRNPVNNLYDAVGLVVQQLNIANGDSDQELTMRILKLVEETGEAVQAWIGVKGQNPRKGITHTREQVISELADVVITALVAMESLGGNIDTVMSTRACRVVCRIDATP